MNKPVFSIVIPTFNSLELLRRALSSALQQQGVAMEVIVTDDSTTTDIADYVASLGDERLRYFRNQPSLGAVKNWNSGLAKATGQYVILMHHDEAMSGDDYLQRVQRLMDGGADVVVSSVEVTIGDRVKPSHFTAAMKRFMLRHPSWLFFANAVGPCACLAFRRSQLQPFCDELRWLVDVEWYYRMLASRRVVYDPQLVVRSIHGHEGQITANLDIRSTFAADCPVVVRLHPELSVRLMLWLYKAVVINAKSTK